MLEPTSVKLDEEFINSIVEVGKIRNKPDFYQSIFTLFCQQAEEIIPLVSKAIEEKDNSSMSSLVHKLKGGAKNVGAEEVAESCARLQAVGSASNCDFSEARVQVAKIERAVLLTREIVNQKYH